MTVPRLTYAAVTPARDEADHLPRLAAAMLAQDVTPLRWVIVENGSSDSTFELAGSLAAQYDWIQVIRTASSERYDRTSPYMRAWHAGVDALDGSGDLVVKLDADVSFEPGYFAGVLDAFELDPGLGIASGTCLEEHRGEWREWVLLGDHCWGPTRTYRRKCLEEILPLDEGIGYASIDETKARLAGYETRTLRDLSFRHHRPEGSGEGGRWRNWVEQGKAAHYTRYRLSYLLARCLYRAVSDPPAVGLLAGYLGASMRRTRRCRDDVVVSAIRDSQRMRNFLAVVRAAR